MALGEKVCCQGEVFLKSPPAPCCGKDESLTEWPTEDVGSRTVALHMQGVVSICLTCLRVPRCEAPRKGCRESRLGAGAVGAEGSWGPSPLLGVCGPPPTPALERPSLRPHLLPAGL